MAEMRSLNPQQLNAAGYIAAGMSQKETGQRLNVARKTIGRWAASQAFKDEVQKRKDAISGAHSEAIEKAHVADVDRFYNELEKYRAAQVEAQVKQFEAATRLIEKALARLADLPDEAIPPNMLPQYFLAAAKLRKDAAEAWAEAIGINHVVQRISAEERSDRIS